MNDKQTKVIPSALSIMSADSDIDLYDIAGIILRNAGTATVNLWHGLYTLDSKETLSLNVTEFNAFMNLQNVPVSFDTTTGDVKKLQIVILKASKTTC